MSRPEPEFAPRWLNLREPADADARAPELIDRLLAYLGEPDRLLIRDLGCGTGSMGRWLSGRLARTQHWILQDRDPALLALASESMTGHGVTAETRQGDLTQVRADDLADASLVTASAVLDLLTQREVDGLAAACASAKVPALLTLSVTGKVEFDPPDPLDGALESAFNDHQRRTVSGRRLLGPDAVTAAVTAFREHGAEVVTQPSPWRLGPQQAALTDEWLRGWVDAAVEAEPGLADAADDYLRRRLDGGIRVVVGHADLLALPRAA